MTQPTLHVVPAATAATRASRLDEHVALFQGEHRKLMALDEEILTLRQQRQTLLEQIPPAKVRREALRQGRINELMGGVVSRDAAQEYRELGELLEDAKEAQTLSERQELRLALPLHQAHLAVTSAMSMVAGCYESYLDHRVAPAILKPLEQRLGELAALTHAKACILGPEGAQRWAQNELARALKAAMANNPPPLDNDSAAAREVLTTATRPRAHDLLALCDTLGKRQCLQRELADIPGEKETK